jgi:hypothetical protein
MTIPPWIGVEFDVIQSGQRTYRRAFDVLNRENFAAQKPKN